MIKPVFVVVGFGLLLLLIGLAMPATQTHTSTTCVDSQYEPASGCVQTNYTTPNFGRGIFISIGLALTIGGGLATIFLSDSPTDGSIADEPTSELSESEISTNEDTEPTTLHEKIQEQQNDENK